MLTDARISLQPDDSARRTSAISRLCLAHSAERCALINWQTALRPRCLPLPRHPGTPTTTAP